jgi:acyl-CoA thioester hydrolase
VKAVRERPAIPSLEEVQQLPRLLELTVPPEYEDYNGHMKITHHLGLHDDAGPAFFSLLGLDEAYFVERRNGIVDLEHHIRYAAEVFAGDRVAVHSRLLARSAKTMHGIWFLANLSREQVANTLEFVSVHIDQEQRRASPFPADLAARLDRVIAEHGALAWEPPLCGFIGVGRDR